MEYFVAITVLLVLLEVSYLLWKTLQKDKAESGSILLDTSVLIDGRILPIARSGLVSAPLVVPKSVVRELQYMADKADHDKRERARFGLDMIEKLQHLDGVTLRVVDDGATDQYGVDEQLIVLAQRWDARLCTIDYNLNKSARVQDVQVININELAHALRVTYLPGEELEITIVQAGQGDRQGVGYLDDGTMVVVDDAKALIGQTVRVTATRVLQTAAGKMMFARRVGVKQASKSQTTKVTIPKTAPRRTHDTPEKIYNPSVQRTERRPRQSNFRRPKTHEDSLVELANK